MQDFKLKGRCRRCNKTRFFIRKAVVRLPMGAEATSKDFFCLSCHKQLVESVNKLEQNHE